MLDDPVKVTVADRKGMRDQAECAAMEPVHPPSTSMVEGDHATTDIDRFIVWMVTSTAAERSDWMVTLTEFNDDDCSRAAYDSCYRSH